MNRAERAYHEIRDSIMDGRLPPGAQLSEASLARQLGMSRTPVREALGRLHAEGLITRARNGMLSVVEPTLADVLDMYDLRALMEGYAAFQAAQRATEPEAEALLAAAKALDTDDFTPEQELRFHRTLVEMARLSPLTRTFQAHGLVQYALVVGYRLALIADNTDLVHPHEAIAQAIAARDPQAAQEAARLHVVEGKERVARVVSVSRPLDRLIASGTLAWSGEAAGQPRPIQAPRR